MFVGCLLFGQVVVAGSDWMREVGGGKKLSEFTILGTHNSGALRGGIYGRCQRLGLKEQLELGVRFLDIRCQLKGGELHVVHGMTDQKMKFREVKDVCLRFLKEHPGETILMSVKEESSKGLRRGEFGKAFGGMVLKDAGRWYQGKGIPKLADVRGKTVVISRNAEVKGIPWKAFRVQDSYWIGRGNSLDAKWKKVVGHFEVQRKKPAASINFVSCTGVLTPPVRAAGRLNGELVGYLREEGREGLGIVVVDFVDAEVAGALSGE